MHQELREHPDHADTARYYLGQVAYALGKYNNAIQHFRQYMRDDPDSTEVPYDGVDNDCEGGDLQDADGDQFLSLQTGGSDCDDTDATVFPGAAEVCDDNVDNDCDERVDKDDEECAGCNCEASIAPSSSDRSQGLLIALLVGVMASLRRRRD